MLKVVIIDSKVIVNGVEYIPKPKEPDFVEIIIAENAKDENIIKAFNEISNFMQCHVNRLYVFNLLKTHGYFMTHTAPRIYVRDLVTYIHAPKKSSLVLSLIIDKYGENVTEEALKTWLIVEAYCTK
jgi:hypothetical protein